MIEIEERARFDAATYERVKKQLEALAEEIHADDKEVVYYIYPDKLLKAVHNISEGTCKLSYKSKKVGGGTTVKEEELILPGKHFAGLIIFCDSAYQDATKRINSPQKRTNYKIGDLEVALKYTNDYGHHLEIDALVANEAAEASAHQKILALSKSLDIKLMTQQDLLDLQKEIEAHS